MNNDLHDKLTQQQSQQLNKLQVKVAFNRAASTYDDVAVLQQQVGDIMIERLGLVKKQFDNIVDIGSGTGECVQDLKSLYKRAKIYSLDLAIAMHQRAKQKQSWLSKIRDNEKKYLCGDAEALPLADNCMDLIFSNLTVQWCNNIEQAISEFHRVLRPGGLLMFSTLGPDTLKELRESWSAADGNAHVHGFMDMHNVGDILLCTNFSDPVMDVENFTLMYQDVKTLMRELKALGAHNAHMEKANGLMGKKRINTMIDAYENFRQDGKLPATYEVVYGHAWKAENTKQQTVNVQLTR